MTRDTSRARLPSLSPCRSAVRLGRFAQAGVAVAAISTVGCGIHSAELSSLGSAPGHSNEVGFALGGIHARSRTLTSTSESLEIRVDHAASVGSAMHRDDVWKSIGPDLPPTFGVTYLVPQRTLVLCEGGGSPESCRPALELDENGNALTTVRGFPTFLEGANLGFTALAGEPSQTSGARRFTTGFVREPAAVDELPTPATPSFGVWVLLHPVAWVQNNPNELPRLVGGPLMFCRRTADGPRCRLVPLSHSLGHVLSVQTLRHGSRFEHVVWYRLQKVPKLVRCQADDHEGNPTCQTIEVM